MFDLSNWLQETILFHSTLSGLSTRYVAFFSHTKMRDLLRILKFGEFL